MKKIFAILMALVIMVAFNVTAFAANENFVSSPSGNAAPTIVASSSNIESGTAQLKIHSFRDRNTLSENDKIVFETSYNMIKNATSLAELTPAINDIATQNNTEVKDLAVSELFYITAESSNGELILTLKADTFKNFRALLNYSNDVWTVVKDAHINDDGNLTFTSDKLGSFAVLVESEKTLNTPVTPPTPGDNLMVWIIVSVSVFVGVIIAIVINCKRIKNLKKHS